MGYFPLPELKGKPNRIFVDGKTLNQIAKESGIRLDTVQHRYSRGIRDYEGLTKPSHIRVEHEKTQRKTYSIMSAGERVMERIWELDIPLQTISDKTGISRSTIYAFLYNGTDLSSMRLAKICSFLGLSMDYVMIDQCDAIYVLLNYENSKGTKKEIEYAKSTGKRVIYQNSTEVRDQNGNSWSWVNRPLWYSDYPVGYGNYWEYPWRRCW